MANEYGLGDIAFRGQTIKTTSGTETFQMKVWGGMLRVNITKNKEYKPIFERPLSAEKTTVIKQVIQKILKASPNTKMPIVFSAYDQDNKKPVIDFVLTFLKDDSNIYHVEMQWKGNKFDCVLKGPYGVAYGSDPMNDAEKSEIELLTMYDWLDRVAPMQCVLTNRKREFDAKANGSSYTSNKGTTAGGQEEDEFPF